jgi:hypothetical protein
MLVVGKGGLPAQVIMSNKNGGGKPPFPTTSMLLKVGCFHCLSLTKSRKLRAPARAIFQLHYLFNKKSGSGARYERSMPPHELIPPISDGRL